LETDLKREASSFKSRTGIIAWARLSTVSGADSDGVAVGRGTGVIVGRAVGGSGEVVGEADVSVGVVRATGVGATSPRRQVSKADPRRANSPITKSNR
jgi:hypothetical protein